jgi:hypothetical protein
MFKLSLICFVSLVNWSIIPGLVGQMISGAHFHSRFTFVEIKTRIPSILVYWPEFDFWEIPFFSSSFVVINRKDSRRWLRPTVSNHLTRCNNYKRKRQCGIARRSEIKFTRELEGNNTTFTGMFRLISEIARPYYYFKCFCSFTFNHALFCCCCCFFCTCKIPWSK